MWGECLGGREGALPFAPGALLPHHNAGGQPAPLSPTQRQVTCW